MARIGEVPEKRKEGELIKILRNLSGNQKLEDKGLYTHSEITDLIGKENMSSFYKEAQRLQVSTIGLTNSGLGIYNDLFNLKPNAEVTYHGGLADDAYKEERSKIDLKE